MQLAAVRGESHKDWLNTGKTAGRKRLTVIISKSSITKHTVVTISNRLIVLVCLVYSVLELLMMEREDFALKMWH